MKRVAFRPQADRDIDAALVYYTIENPKIARDFLREVQNVSRKISLMPGIGSPRIAQELNIGGLRSRAPHTFPYLLLYFERDDHIDVARVLHSSRDIFNLLLGLE